MKTYPISRPDGTLLAFEVTSTWVTYRSLFRILRAVEGVKSVRRKWFNEDRAEFLYLGEPCVVWEAWGDSNRYWIGPKEAETSKLDVAPIHLAFQRHNGLWVRLWLAFHAKTGA